MFGDLDWDFGGNPDHEPGLGIIDMNYFYH